MNVDAPPVDPRPYWQDQTLHQQKIPTSWGTFTMSWHDPNTLQPQNLLVEIFTPQRRRAGFVRATWYAELLFINMIEVEEEYRCVGLGSYLLDTVLTCAREHGMLSV